jgi:hypothetical protein
MLKVSTEENLADIGTKGHDNEMLNKRVGLNNLVCLDVDQCPETIAASATTSGMSSIDLRAALSVVAVATAAYMPLAGASAQICTIESSSAQCTSVSAYVLACILVASVMLNIILAALVCRSQPRRRKPETATIGVQSQCTYTRWNNHHVFI